MAKSDDGRIYFCVFPFELFAFGYHKNAVKDLVLLYLLQQKKNLPSRRTVAKSLKCLVSTAKKNINTSLNFKKIKKIFSLFFSMPLRQTYNAEVNSVVELFIRKKWKNIVQIDEDWVYLNYSNKTISIYYYQRGEEILKHGSMYLKKVLGRDLRLLLALRIIAGFAQIKNKESAEKQKTHSTYSEKYSLLPLINYEISPFYTQ